jgi:hypothetical protein
VLEDRALLDPELADQALRILNSLRRRADVAYDILTSVPSLGCASLPVVAWLVEFAAFLARAIGQENFPRPPPLIEMAIPVHIALSALTGVELLLMIVIARLSGYLHVPTRAQSALQQRLALRRSMAARSLLGV